MFYTREAGVQGLLLLLLFLSFGRRMLRTVETLLCFQSKTVLIRRSGKNAKMFPFIQKSFTSCQYVFKHAWKASLNYIFVLSNYN